MGDITLITLTFHTMCCKSNSTMGHL